MHANQLLNRKDRKDRKEVKQKKKEAWFKGG
jgi:hypothetical protein